MEATHYDDLSIYVPKNQLDKLITKVQEDQYRIFWGFNKGNMILNIYNSEVNNKLIFKRHKGYLELIEAKLKCESVLRVLDHDIAFTDQVALQTKEDLKRDSDAVYREIDYFLMELAHFKKRDDHQAVENIKKKLHELTEEWKQLGKS